MDKFEPIKLLPKAVFVTAKFKRAVVIALKRVSVRVIIAPYEADGQLARLFNLGDIEAVASGDGDLLVLGCTINPRCGARSGLCTVVQVAGCVFSQREGRHMWDGRAVFVLLWCFVMGPPAYALVESSRLYRSHSVSRTRWMWPAGCGWCAR